MDLTRHADTYWAAKDDTVDGERLEFLMRFVPDGAPVLVVDGGPGMLAARLKERGHDVCMTDVSGHAVERARAKGLVAEQVDTDDAQLPHADDSFPCVISDSAIEHRYWPEKAVGECARVLAPGGTFILLVPNVAHWRYRLGLLFGRFPEIEGAASDRAHLRMLALPEARRLVRAVGLDVRSIRGFPSLWVKGLYPRFLRAPGISAVYRGLCRLRPTLFGRDVMLVCRKPA